VTVEAEILTLASGFRFRQKMGEPRDVRVVTSRAGQESGFQRPSQWWKIEGQGVCRQMRTGFLVCVAFKTEGWRTASFHFDIADALAIQHSMTGSAAHLHRGVNVLALGLILMAGCAVGGRGYGHWVYFGFERHADAVNKHYDH
jgi:hypothetical protein